MEKGPKGLFSFLLPLSPGLVLHPVRRPGSPKSAGRGEGGKEEDRPNGEWEKREGDGWISISKKPPFLCPILAFFVCVPERSAGLKMEFPVQALFCSSTELLQRV